MIPAGDTHCITRPLRLRRRPGTGGPISMTRKACSVAFTIGWASALTFGWIALAAPPDAPVGTRTINMILAAFGAGAGLWSWMRVRRDI